MQTELPDIRTDIDENNLVEDARIQPSQVRAVREVAAHVEWQKTVAENSYKVTLATVKNEIRSNPAQYGLLKTTNDAVDDVASVDPRVLAAMESVNTAIYRLNMVLAVQEALVDRKKMLTIMADLILNDIRGTPQMSGRVPSGIRPREGD